MGCLLLLYPHQWIFRLKNAWSGDTPKNYRWEDSRNCRPLGPCSEQRLLPLLPLLAPGIGCNIIFQKAWTITVDGWETLSSSLAPPVIGSIWGIWVPLAPNRSLLAAGYWKSGTYKSSLTFEPPGTYLCPSLRVRVLLRKKTHSRKPKWFPWVCLTIYSGNF